MPLKCSQCQTPALYIVGDSEKSGTPLCLACWGRLQDITYRNFLMHAAGMNHASDEMDAMVGLGQIGARFPVEALAKAVSMSRTYNSIRVASSNIGVINTGNLARIDAAITISQGTDQAEFAARLKDLVETVAAEKAATPQQKKEIVEVASAISDQVISKTPSRTVIETLFTKLTSLASGASTIGAATKLLYEAWKALS
ncbi:hypothetical protein ACQR09_25055 [Bradyrhizobium oligotrophicum]|uniref:hypothetical protein n=1 Tax=Bradyrhizobium oligotrophicum TaxID=44255 RepID=UPI003EB7368E